MPSPLPTLQDLVFPVGQSPFHIKGATFIDTLAMVGEVPGGREACLAALPSEELRRYVGQCFLAGSWYDIYPMLFLDAAAAQAWGLSYDRWLRESSERGAERQLGGLYRPLLRLLSPQTLTSGLLRLGATYFDFLQIRGAPPEEEFHGIRVEGAPALVAYWLRSTLPPYLATALRLAGMDPGRLHVSASEPGPMVHGQPTLVVSLSVALGSARRAPRNTLPGAAPPQS